MRKPVQLTEADTRAVFGVVLETLDLGHDPIAWRRRFLSGLGALIDAEMWLSNIMPISPAHQGAKIPLAVRMAATPEALKRQDLFWEIMDVPRDPLTPLIMAEWD